ncbi:MAG TPA: MauE/DoxX family redox-associated membrane protein [Dehalococcoidia bacterium]|nr:MauE/DoxX family redox-associated membrane protein [Dehalococcoidia bacterium]
MKNVTINRAWQALSPYWRLAEPFLLHRYLALASRIALGGVFIFAGAVKLGYIETLIWEINQYNMLPHQLATAYGYVLPPLEIVLGIFLVVGLLLRVSSAVSGLLILSFAIAKITALARGLDIDICPCFGPAVPLLTAYSLALDVVLLALAVQIFYHRGEFLALGSWFSRKAAELDEQEDE